MIWVSVQQRLPGHKCFALTFWDCFFPETEPVASTPTTNENKTRLARVCRTVNEWFRVCVHMQRCVCKRPCRVKWDVMDRQTGAVFVSQGWGVTLAAFPESSTELHSVRLARGSGPAWHWDKKNNKKKQKHQDVRSRAERSGPGAEEQAYDSLLYPLAIGGHFIQCILHTDAHVLNGINLVHEALSLWVLQEDR